MMLFSAMMLFRTALLSAAFAAPPQDPDTGIPGDEGSLRNQAFVPQVNAVVRAKIDDAEKALEEHDPARAFALFRQAIAAAADDPAGGTLLALAPNADGRLLTDLTAHVRRRAAALAPAEVEKMLSDAEGAARVEIGTALSAEAMAARAARFPRTRAALEALSRAAALCYEVGDLAGARAAADRALEQGAGTPAERAGLILLSRSIAQRLGDSGGLDATDEEKHASVTLRGESLPLGDALRSLAAALPIPPSRAPLRCAWMVPSGAPLEPANLEPVLRRAAVTPTLVLVQTAKELLALDAADGRTRGRVSLAALGGEAAAQAKAPSLNARSTVVIGLPEDPDASLIFPGRRRALPVAEDRFAAVTRGGVIASFALDAGAPEPLQFLWSRTGSALRRADGTVVQEGGAAPADSTEAAAGQLYYADGALLAGGRLFAASFRVGEDTTTYLEAFRPDTGERLFRRFIAKGSVMRSSDNQWRSSARAVSVLPSSLTYAGGKIIFSTEFGIVASVDPLDGEVDYALRTQRAKEPAGYEWSMPAAASGEIFAAPADSDYLYALHVRLPRFGGPAAQWPLPFAFDGAPQARKPRVRETRYARLVGAYGTSALLLNPRPRQAQSLRAFDFRTRVPDEREFGAGEAALGLPAVVGDGLYQSTDHGITAYSLADGLAELQQTPLVPRDPEAPLGASAILGDLSPAPDGVVSLTQGWIAYYQFTR